MKDTVLNRLVAVLGISSGLAAASPSVLAADSGWFIGASLGQSKADIDKSDLDDLVVYSFQSGGYPVLSGSSTLDNSETSFGVNAGYRFSPYIAVEGGYVKLASADYASSGTVNPPGPVTSTPASASIGMENRGFTLGGLANAPIGEKFDLHARLGLYFATTDVNAAISNSGYLGLGDDSVDTQEIYYGIGAGLKLSEQWRLNADWTRYNDVGDEDSTGEANVDNLGVSVTFHF